MALRRMISRSFSTSRKRARLYASFPSETAGTGIAEFALMLYPLLVVHADDWGRQAGDAETIKLVIDPASPRSLADFDLAIAALADVGLITTYDVADQRVIAITAFDAHQYGLHRRTASQFPDPPQTLGKPPDVGNFPTTLGKIGIERARGTELNRTELNRTEEKARASARTSNGRSRSSDPARSVRTIAQLVIAEGVAHNDEGELIELVKRKAARLKIPYTTAAVQRAIRSASAQQRKAATK